MTIYQDMANLPEDKRIEMIAHRAVDHKEKIGFIVETGAKADRYMQKLHRINPLIREVKRIPFGKNAVLVQVSLAAY